MDLKGYSAWISVDGNALKEYNIEISNGDSASCWIASETGKNFTVNWRDSNRTSRVTGFVKLDGIGCGGHTIPPTLFGMPFMPITVQKSAIPTSIMTEKPFLFSPLDLTDDDSFLDQHTAVNDLGEITITIWRVAIVAATENHGVQFPENQKIHERSKKALAHCIKLGEEIFTPQRQPVRVVKTDTAPLVTFTFKYRSLEMLKANGVVPVADQLKRPAAAQREVEGMKQEIIDIEDDHDHEIKALETRLNTLKAQRSSSNGNPSKRVKREPANHSPLAPGEIIDLT